MSRIKVNVIGNGSFGTFLREKQLMKWNMEQDINADIVILAVPFKAYEEVAKSHRGKHLVNVCSIQEESNKICAKYSDRVTGIHPLFGERSESADRKFALTFSNSIDSFVFVDELKSHGCRVIVVNASDHDKFMAKTHAKVIEISDQILEFVKSAKGVPEELLTPSFKKMRDLAEQLLDMPEGTKSSILANKYIDKD